jgi:hypothetical protein
MFIVVDVLGTIQVVQHKGNIINVQTLVLYGRPIVIWLEDWKVLASMTAPIE